MLKNNFKHGDKIVCIKNSYEYDTMASYFLIIGNIYTYHSEYSNIKEFLILEELPQHVFKKSIFIKLSEQRKEKIEKLNENW